MWITIKLEVWKMDGRSWTTATLGDAGKHKLLAISMMKSQYWIKQNEWHIY